MVSSTITVVDHGVHAAWLVLLLLSLIMEFMLHG